MTKLRPWVVAGATGFLGSHVVEQLLARHIPVIGVNDLLWSRQDYAAECGARFLLPGQAGGESQTSPSEVLLAYHGWGDAGGLSPRSGGGMNDDRAISSDDRSESSVRGEYRF